MSFFDKKTKQPKPDWRVMLSEFNRSLMLIADKTLLINHVITKIQQLCPVKSIYIFLADYGTGNFKIQNPDDRMPIISFTEKGRLVHWLATNEKELIVALHPDIVNYFTDEEKAILNQLDTAIIYPLFVMSRINGIVLLGHKTDKQPFTKKDTEVLFLLFNQAVFAIEHAMLYEQQTERIKKMYRSDRLAILGELAAGAAHEIRNPLTSISSTIQYLSKDYAPDSAKYEMFQEVLTEAERINKILQGLLSFARPTALNKTDVNLEQLLNQTLLLTKSTVVKQQIDIQLEYFTENATIQGDGEQLKQVFLNIILNAIEAMKDNPPDKLRTLIVSIEKGAVINLSSSYLIISFEDSGRGIAENDIEDIFTPFFTTKEEGTGLGLAICYGIVNRHQGDIEVKSKAGKGTVVQVKLPQIN